MTGKGGTSPACAACKYRRRKCPPTCPLALYFPADQPKIFRNVHRLFGVSNITKTLNSLNTKDEKEDAMKSIIYEAEMRERFPVYGCSVIICQLHQQLQNALEELRIVNSQLAMFKEQQSNEELDSSLCYKEQKSNKQVYCRLPYKDQQSHKQDDCSLCYKQQQSNKEGDYSLCSVTDTSQLRGNKVIDYTVDQFLNDGFYNAESLEKVARPLLRSDILSSTYFFTPFQPQMYALMPLEAQMYTFNTIANKSRLELASKDQQSSQGDLKNAATGFSTVN